MSTAHPADSDHDWVQQGGWTELPPVSWTTFEGTGIMRADFACACGDTKVVVRQR